MRNDSKAVAEAVADLVNNMSFDSETFVDTMMTQHRTLQQSTFRLFIDTMKRWEEMGKIGLYDARNEQTVSQSKIMLDAMRASQNGVDYVGSI